MVLVQVTLKRIAALSLLIPTLALGLGGCGSGGGETTSGAAASGAEEGAAPAHYTASSDLRRQLANAFDAGLYRLAVMSQPRDSATDLGQSLPTGLVRTVSCGRAGAPAGSEGTEVAQCAVAWETVAGTPRTTRYLVRLFPTGCFAAGATPRLPQHRDNTIQTFSQHPLNALVSAARQCS
ncbi:MAG TPA: hypothetical protein VJL81_13725 [Solirubrobacterales bacterium]|nr:hypothetical protein [Solirubrobacterales bacterium]